MFLGGRGTMRATLLRGGNQAGAALAAAKNEAVNHTKSLASRQLGRAIIKLAGVNIFMPLLRSDRLCVITLSSL